MRNKPMASVAILAGGIAAAVLFTLAFSGVLTAYGDPAEKIHKVEGDVQNPVKISGDPPAYPEEARKERAEGVVIVRAVIDREGYVASTEIVEADREDLAAAAAEAIGSWTFEPATLEGEPVSVYYHLTVRFRLDGEKSEPDDQEPSLR